MTDRDFDVHAYDQGYRDGRHDAAAEIDRLREALEKIYQCSNQPIVIEISRAALGDEK
jgi:hypothetical protein